MEFGFSYIGLIYLIMLFVPNIIWTRKLPSGYEESSGKENKLLLAFERAGEVLVSAECVLFANLNIHRGSPVYLLIISFLLMLLYEYYWIRYFRSSRTMEDFYSGLLGIPVAGASYPVLAFLFLGLYGNSIILIVSTIILGIGHIGIHLEHRSKL